VNILITGHRGFVGNNLLTHFADKPNINIELPAIDIKNEQSVKSVLEYSKPNIIIHLAANPRGNADLSAMDDNCKGTHLLAHYAPPDCHFIFASTIVVYGDYQHLDFIEDMECKPTSLYALSKLNAENIINRYERLGKFRKTNLRFSAIVGPGLTHGFMFDLINKIKSEDGTLKLFGREPGSIKPFIHIEDVCRAIEYVLDNRVYGTYNICPQDNISVKDIAKLTMEYFGEFKKIEWQPDKIWEGDNLEIKARNSKIFSKGFDFKYKTSKQAILGFLNYVKSNRLY
jgi:UDP-glucose 4-epimerase